MKVNKMLSSMKNAVMGKVLIGRCEKTRVNQEMLDKWYEMGYIRGYRERGKQIEVMLKYKEGDSIIKEVRQVSKGSHRIIWKIKNVEEEIIKGRENGMGKIFMLSTRVGIKTHIEAYKGGMGGEVLCYII